MHLYPLTPAADPSFDTCIVQHTTMAGCDSTLVSYDMLVMQYIYLRGQNSELGMTSYSSWLQSICKVDVSIAVSIVFVLFLFSLYWTT